MTDAFMKLYLHIGIHKTGTSSIQASLRQNRQILNDHGVIFPIYGDNGTSGHSQAVTALAGFNGNIEEFDLFRELQSSGCHTAILSSENFSHLRSKSINTISELLATFFDSISVIVYLRRQDYWLESVYKQKIKHNMTRLSDLWPTDLKSIAQYDYSQLLDPWGLNFGFKNIKVRCYEPRQFMQGDLVFDFYHTCGLGGICDSLQAADFKNASMDNSSTTLLAHLNKKGMSSKLRNYIISCLMKSQQPSQPETTFFSVKQRKDLLREVSDSNAFIARNYLGRENGELFFDSSIPEYPQIEQNATAINKAVDLIVELSNLSLVIDNK